jgi:hypothetical protein
LAGVLLASGHHDPGWVIKEQTARVDLAKPRCPG